MKGLGSGRMVPSRKPDLYSLMRMVRALTSDAEDQMEIEVSDADVLPHWSIFACAARLSLSEAKSQAVVSQFEYDVIDLLSTNHNV